MRYWYPVMSAAAIHVPILLIRMFMESGALEQLLHEQAPFGERRPEPADQEEEVMPRGDELLEGAVRLPRDSLLPVSPDCTAATTGNHDGHPVGASAISIKQELQSADIDLSSRPENPLDVPACAESFCPSKASSHLRRTA